jgi:hypothetical protein
MADFIPIDHNDSDDRYRESVRRHIAAAHNVTLSDLSDPDLLIGKWQHSAPQSPNFKPKTISFYPDGTFQIANSRSDGPKSKWQVTADTYTQTIWCPPMPEYGVDEGCWTQDVFHCAMIDRDRLILWNGDGSVVWLFTRIVG